MFVRFDYRCSHCGHREERFVKKDVMDQQPCREDTCLVARIWPFKMTRLPAATRTLFRFNDKRLKD